MQLLIYMKNRDSKLAPKTHNQLLNLLRIIQWHLAEYVTNSPLSQTVRLIPFLCFLLCRFIFKSFVTVVILLLHCLLFNSHFSFNSLSSMIITDDVISNDTTKDLVCWDSDRCYTFHSCRSQTIHLITCQFIKYGLWEGCILLPSFFF